MPPSLKRKAPLFGFLETVIDVLLPPRCLGTGEIVDAQGMVSPALWAQLQFIEAPLCMTCGMPFGFKVEGEVLCAACMEMPPLFDRARAAVVYTEASRKMILSFKYGDRLHAVHTFTPWMLRAGQVLVEEADLVIPVPLHRGRLRQRKFNQSALLAQEIARLTGKVCKTDALLRVRQTLPQQGLSRSERTRNVSGAFVANERRCSLKDSKVLLVDDVFTSGATLNECARVLRKAGVAQVDVLTIARVTKEEFS